VQTGNPLLPGPSSSTPTFEGFRNAVRDAVPTVVLAAEHYNMLVRMVQAGASPQLRIEVGARFYEDDLNSYNVLAEIPGTDPVLRDAIAET
jgi:hypothetical protein